MPGWESFFVAEIGAAAALAGLIFVGISINLTKIISAEVLTGRGLEALLFLVTVLVISTLLLVPGQPTWLAGMEVLVAGVIAWAGILALQLSNLRKVDPNYKGQLVQWTIFAQVATLPYVVTGIAILIAGADGLYWIVPAIIFSFISALADAWVLLVEINR